MARTKITAYVTPDVADAVKRLAAIDDRSMSDIIEDSILRRLAHATGEAEHAALIAKLDHLSRRLGAIEAGQETHFELTAQMARFSLSVAPDIPEADRAALNARGGDRYRNMVAMVASRLISGRSSWRDVLAYQQSETEKTAARREAAE